MGTLYLVPTPVGNLEDITMRALKVLREADLILAEDTRTSGNLLKHFDIKNAMLSYHKFNEHKTVESIVERLLAGQTIAVVSDAGTPGISDPGFLVAREAIKAGIEVITLPGATAFVPALVSSGLPCDRFCFEGFLPQAASHREGSDAVHRGLRTRQTSQRLPRDKQDTRRERTRLASGSPRALHRNRASWRVRDGCGRKRLINR